MDLRKRLILKPIILGAVGLIVLGYSIYRQKTGPDPVPEIETVKRLLRDPAPHSEEDYTAAWNRAEALLMTRKKYDDVHRLNTIMRGWKKLSKRQALLLDFSDYTACFYSGRHKKAMEHLNTLSARGDLPEGLRYAVEGEKMRVLAAEEGIGSAMKRFQSIRKELSGLPESAMPLCRTAVLLLLQYGKKEEAYALLTDCAASVPEERRRLFLEPLGVYLVRLEKEPERKRDSLIPAKDVSGYFTVSVSMADEYARKNRMTDAEKLLRSLAENPKIPDKFREMARLKLNIMKEKQKK